MISKQKTASPTGGDTELVRFLCHSEELATKDPCFPGEGKRILRLRAAPSAQNDTEMLKLPCHSEEPATKNPYFFGLCGGCRGDLAARLRCGVRADVGIGPYKISLIYSL